MHTTWGSAPLPSKKGGGTLTVGERNVQKGKIDDDRSCRKSAREGGGGPFGGNVSMGKRTCFVPSQIAAGERGRSLAQPLKEGRFGGGYGLLKKGKARLAKKWGGPY